MAVAYYTVLPCGHEIPRGRQRFASVALAILAGQAWEAQGRAFTYYLQSY